MVPGAVLCQEMKRSAGNGYNIISDVIRARNGKAKVILMRIMRDQVSE